MVKDIHCPICKGNSIYLKWAGGALPTKKGEAVYACTTLVRNRPNVFSCKDCKHEFLRIDNIKDTLVSEYENLKDEEYEALAKVKRKTFERAFARLDPYLSKGSTVLEVGSYLGIFLETLQLNGITGVGVEPSIWAIEKCKLKNLDVIQGAFEDKAEAIDTLFEAVVSWDVLEHVLYPGEFMALLASKVLPGGVLVISTLDRSTIVPRITRSRWPWIIPMHLHYFDKETVIELARVAGCKLLKHGSHTHYASLEYVILKFETVAKIMNFLRVTKLFRKIVLPFSFGDVRYYVFIKN
jgi:SAM-dependent methyltransferase